MKKFLGAVLLLSLFVVSCNDETDPNTFRLGEELNFQVGHTNLSSDNSLNFSILEVADSRCPSDVVCIWAGKADVKIGITSPVASQITLNTSDKPTETVGGYSFKLISVSPYPVSTKTIKTSDYDIKLKITKL